MATTGDGEGKKTLKSMCDSLFPTQFEQRCCQAHRGSFCLSAWIQHSLGRCKSPVETLPSVTVHREALITWLKSAPA